MSTKIEWCDRSDWNPLVGCSKAGSACRHCYALRRAVLLAHNPSVSEEVRLAYQKTINHVGGKWEWSGNPQWIADRLDKPLRWKQKKCECLHGQAIVQNKGEPFRQVVLCPHCNGIGKHPLRIFVNSMGDLFHENINLRGPELESIFRTISASDHIFIVLTKRPERMKRFIDERYEEPLPNLHLYVSVWDQASADEFIPILLDTPAAVRGVSIEPMLGPVDILWALRPQLHPNLPCLNHVILGGETGPGARPMHPDWAKSVRDQCHAAGVPFFMKKMSGGNEPPDDLLVREMPT